MNLSNTLLIVTFYLCGEFIKMTISSLELPQDSPEKKKQLTTARKKLSEQVSYRNRAEESARIKAEERKNKYETETESVFGINEPDEGYSQKLWQKAKKASDDYDIIIAKFKRNIFCDRPMSDTVCKRAFKNSFFKKEKLTYDSSKSFEGNGCISVIYSKRIEVDKEFDMEYKMCSAKKTNEDPKQFTEVLVFLQAAYKQPPIGKWKFFVLYSYIQNPETQQWEMISNESTQGYYRYEAYLSL